MEFSESTSKLTHSETKEGLSRGIRNLNILVHTSFLIQNTIHPDTYILKTPQAAQYLDKTKQLQKNARQRFTPQSAEDVLLIMPHEKPSLKSWRDSKKAKELDSSAVNWTDAYRDIKRDTPFSNNIYLIGDLSYRYSNLDTQIEKAKNDTNQEITQRLKDQGFIIDEDTVITIGGEYRDLCVNWVVKKILLLPEVKKIRIDKTVSFTSAYSRPFPAEYVAMLDKDKNELLMDILSAESHVREDDEYVYVEK